LVLSLPAQFPSGRELIGFLPDRFVWSARAVDMPSAGELPAAPLDVAALEAAIRHLRLGHPLLYFPALPSTNTYAVERARAGAAEGTLVTTDDQTAGRGRAGRHWKALPGEQLALSLVLRPAFPPQYLVMASAVAVAGAIERVTGVRASIKWPNDILIGGRKVCGILVESSSDFAVLGIGLNVNSSLADDPELAARATTLAQVAGHQVSREELAAALLAELDTLYARLQTGGEQARQALWEQWRARLSMLGAEVTVHQGAERVSGLAEDVAADGTLLLRRADGAHLTVTWGDVEC
jgi:BirA family biotin operon repressor/biotin-[acetyl-CoA-carboxylase] ligase